MAKLIYSMLTSLDGYTEDDQGDFSWATPDEELHSFLNELTSSVGTFLYGRRMYDTMVYWETADKIPDQPDFVLTWARQWQEAEKIVYSRTLAKPRSSRTRIKREFDPDEVRHLKAGLKHDVTVDGPELAASAIRAGLVGEVHQVIYPVIVGGGKRFFPNGVRLDLELKDERRFANGVVALQYTVRI